MNFSKKIIRSIGTQIIPEKSRKFQIFIEIVIYAGMTRIFILRSKTIIFNIKPLKIGEKLFCLRSKSIIFNIKPLKIGEKFFFRLLSKNLFLRNF